MNLNFSSTLMDIVFQVWSLIQADPVNMKLEKIKLMILKEI